MENQCCICERKNGEDGCKLIPIHTAECIVPMCSWPCMVIASTHSFQKCRVCGAVGTVPKWQIPGGLSLGQHTFIIFTEGCKFCHNGKPE